MKKTLGLAFPLGEENSETRKRSDEIMKYIIQPIADREGYQLIRADLMRGAHIRDDINRMIRDTDILIADLTEFNPNVFYEVGIRDTVKGKFISLISKEWVEHMQKDAIGTFQIPFDLKDYRAHLYSISNPEGVNQLSKFILQRIKELEKGRYDPCFVLSTDEVMMYHGITVVPEFYKGAKNHYGLAKTLFDTPCETIFLMQRSSSLVLNAEQGWNEEKNFLYQLKKAIRKCDSFYHIITLEGIESHFTRSNSVFPDFGKFSDNLREFNGFATLKIEGKTKKPFYLRKLPKDAETELFKLDRQARVLIVKTRRGVVRVIIVQNLGDDQTCFEIRGPKAAEYLDACVSFYAQCDLVAWKDIINLYEQYKKIEKARQGNIDTSTN